MSAGEKIPVWLDCDPGHDDAFAILLLTHHPLIHPLGISTVHGNSSLAHTTHNALSLLTAFSATSVPIFPGASTSLVRPAVHAPDIHGESGLDGTSLLPTPTCSANTTMSAVDAIASALLATSKETAWLVATGALTNIALLLQKYPQIAGHLKGLSIMGGAIGDSFTSAPLGHVDGLPRIGNWSPWAEFNILVDPEAASQLFSNPEVSRKTTLIPLDLTHLVLATGEVQKLLLHGHAGKVEGKTELRQMLVELLMFFAKTYADVFGLVDGPPLHDPLAVAVVLGDSEVVFDEGKNGGRERWRVEVVTEGTQEDALKGAQTGRTIVTLLKEGVEGVRIPRGVDVKQFWGEIESCLERADEARAKAA